MGCAAVPSARRVPGAAGPGPNVKSESVSNNTVAPASMVSVASYEMKSRPRTMCGDPARVQVSSVTTGLVWMVCCGPDGSPQPGAASTITTATAAAALMVTDDIVAPGRGSLDSPAPNVTIFRCTPRDQMGVSPMRQIVLVGVAAAGVTAAQACSGDAAGVRPRIALSISVQPDPALPGDTLRVAVNAVPSNGAVVDVIRLSAAGLVTAADSMQFSGDGPQSHTWTYALSYMPPSGDVAFTAAAQGGDANATAQDTVAIADLLSP